MNSGTPQDFRILFRYRMVDTYARAYFEAGRGYQSGANLHMPMQVARRVGLLGEAFDYVVIVGGLHLLFQFLEGVSKCCGKSVPILIRGGAKVGLVFLRCYPYLEGHLSSERHEYHEGFVLGDQTDTVFLLKFDDITKQAGPPAPEVVAGSLLLDRYAAGNEGCGYQLGMRM
jgi:hypothetical protein